MAETDSQGQLMDHAGRSHVSFPVSRFWSCCSCAGATRKTPKDGAPRNLRLSLIGFFQTGHSQFQAWYGEAAALTWYRATLVCSRKAGRLFVDPCVTDLGLPPSTILLDSLPLSTCDLWDRHRGCQEARCSLSPCLPSPGLPTHPPAGSLLEEGELLRCQQDPMGAPQQLQLLEA